MCKSWLKDWMLKTAAIAMAVWAGAMPTAFGADATPVAVTKGAMTVVEVPFEVKSYNIADKDIIRIDAGNETRKLQIVGLKEGKTGVQVSGEGEAGVQYTVTVSADISALLTTVKRLLEEVPGVDATVDAATGKIMLQGVAVGVTQWNQLQKVVDTYSPNILNFARCEITPEAKKNVMDALEKAGLKVVEKNAPEAGRPGIITLQASGGSLMLSGTVLNRSELDKIYKVLAAQQWIIAKPGDDAAKAANKVTAIVDVGVDSRLVEIGVAFVGIREADFSERSLNLLKAGLMTVSDTSLALQGKLGKNTSENGGILTGQYNIKSGIEGTLRLLSGDGATKSERIGHLTVKNNSDAASFRDGGTLKVKVSGQTSGDLKDIPYGLELKANVALSDVATAEMLVNTSVSLPRLQENGDYDVMEQRLDNLPVTCKLGETLILAGSKQTMASAANEGVPVLRQIPVINWFFSEKTKAQDEVRLLILINPQLAPGSTVAKPYSEQTKSLKDELGKPLSK